MKVDKTADPITQMTFPRNWQLIGDNGPEKLYGRLWMDLRTFACSASALPDTARPGSWAVAIADDAPTAAVVAAHPVSSLSVAASYAGLLPDTDYVLFFASQSSFLDYDPDLDTTPISLAAEAGVKFSVVMGELSEHTRETLESYGMKVLTQNSLESLYSETDCSTRSVATPALFSLHGKLAGHPIDSKISTWESRRKDASELSNMLPGMSPSDIPSAVEALSFKALDGTFATEILEQAVRSRSTVRPDICRYIDFSDAIDYGMSEELDDLHWICSLWNARLDGCGLSLAGGFLPENAELLKAAGRALGIDSYVEAHMAGVLDEDIFAEDPELFYRFSRLRPHTVVPQMQDDGEDIDLW